jgi:hypothetical protein
MGTSVSPWCSPHHKGAFQLKEKRVRSAIDDVASNIRQALYEGVGIAIVVLYIINYLYGNAANAQLARQGGYWKQRDSHGEQTSPHDFIPSGWMPMQTYVIRFVVEYQCSRPQDRRMIL